MTPAEQELTLLKEVLDKSFWHEAGRARYKVMIVPEDAIERIDAALGKKES